MSIYANIYKGTSSFKVVSNHNKNDKIN